VITGATVCMSVTSVIIVALRSISTATLIIRWSGSGFRGVPHTPQPVRLCRSTEHNLLARGPPASRAAFRSRRVRVSFKVLLVRRGRTVRLAYQVG
jgi:hypothetical protein